MAGEWAETPLGHLVHFKTGKLDSNHAVPGGSYPFFTCAQDPLQIDEYAFDCDAILLAGNNANGVFHLNRHRGRFNAYQRTYVITLKESAQADLSYLFYALKTLTAKLASYSQGTATKFLTMKILEPLPVLLPPMGVQRAIARILGTLDEKIELNRRTSETLEAMARELFRSWFIDFDPVRAKAEGRAPSGMDSATAKLFPNAMVDSELGPIPKGWSIQSLDSIADFRNGLALQRFRPDDGVPRLPVVKIAQLRTGEPDSGEWARADIVPSCILENGDVVFSWSGSLTVVVWCGGRAALNQHLFRVTSEIYPKWFYLRWLLLHLPEFQRIARDKATTMGHIQRYHVTAAKCVVPPNDILRSVDPIFSPIVARQVSLDLESRALARTRNELLPRLLAGEVDVSSVAAAIGGPH